MSEADKKKATEIIDIVEETFPSPHDLDIKSRPRKALTTAIAAALTKARAETWDAAIEIVRNVSTGCWGSDLGDTRAKVLREIVDALEAAKDGGKS